LTEDALVDGLFLTADELADGVFLAEDKLAAGFFLAEEACADAGFFWTQAMACVFRSSIDFAIDVLLKGDWNKSKASKI
jgi:hypothetical protein